MKLGVNTKFLVVIFMILVIITESCAKPAKTRRKKQSTTTTTTTSTTSTTAKPVDPVNSETTSDEDQNDFELLPSLNDNIIQEQPSKQKLAKKERIDQISDQENEIIPPKDKERVEDKNPSNYIDQKLPSGPNDKMDPPGVIVPENQKHSDHQNEEVFQGIFKNEATPSPGKNSDSKVKQHDQKSKDTPDAGHQTSHDNLNLEDALDDKEHHNTDGNLKNHDQAPANSLDDSFHTSHEDLDLKDALNESEHHNSIPQDETRNQHKYQDGIQDNLHQEYNEIPGVQEELIIPSVYPTTKPYQEDTINNPFVSTSTHYPDIFEEPAENQIHPYQYPQMHSPYPDTFRAPEHNQIYPYPNPHFGYQNYLDDFQNQLPFNSYAPQFPYHQNPYPYYQNPFSFYQNPYQDDFLSQYHPRNFYNSQTTRWQKFKNFMRKPMNSLKHHFNNFSDKVKNWFKPNNKDQDQIENKSLTLKDFANPQIVQRFLENLSQVLGSITPAVYDGSENFVNYAKNILDTISDSIGRYIMHK